MTTKRKTPKLDELVEHVQRVAMAQQRARALGRDLGEHTGRIGELKQRKIAAHADENESLAGKLRRQIHEGEAQVVDLEQRQAGAQLAARRADAERTKWIADNYRGLVTELEPEAREAARAIDELAEQLLAALKTWQGVSSKVSALGHIAGQTHRVPSLGWDALAKELRHRPKTPLPLPGQFGTMTIIPADDPDEGVREAARQQIREKAKR